MTSDEQRAREMFNQGYSEAEVVRKTRLSAKEAVRLKVSMAAEKRVGGATSPIPPPDPDPEEEVLPVDEAAEEADAEAAELILPDAAPAPAPSPATIPSGTTLTSAGLRSILFQELEALRTGNSTPKQAMAVAKLADGICKTVQIEIVYAERAAALGPDNAPKALSLAGGG